MAPASSLGFPRGVSRVLVRRMATSTPATVSTSRFCKRASCEPALSTLRPTRPFIPSQPLVVTNLRSYHSGDHDAPPAFSPIEATILSAATSHVPAHGFTPAALSLGAKDAGYLEVSVNLFPRGAFDLIHYYLVAQRLALKDPAALADPDGSRRRGVGANVKSSTLQRLRANKDIIRRWQEALAIMAQPSFIAPSLQELFLLADEIWHLAGDTSVDASWYTKRATLSAIYSSADLFMTTDTSPDFQETEKFLDRRLEEVQAAGQTLGAVGEWLGFAGRASVNVLRSKGVRV